MKKYQTLFETITQHHRYLENLDWGEARSGHPEGTIRAHIAELERNLRMLRDKLTEDEYWILKVLIHTHDLFKGEAKQGVSITAPNSHASLARAFLESLEADLDVLVMTQFHDEPYAIWRHYENRLVLNERRLGALLGAIQDWNVFAAFLIVDGCTDGKTRDPLYWFFERMQGRVSSRFTAEDIL